MEVIKKICATCKVENDISHFVKDRTTKDGYTYSCKVCRREKERLWRLNNPEKVKEINLKNKDKRIKFYKSERGIKIYRKAHLKRKYGISLEEYDSILNNQNGVCAICNRQETAERNTFLSVDHCHKENKIRGLLCNNCNRALGLFGDNIELLKSAIEYLKTRK